MGVARQGGLAVGGVGNRGSRICVVLSCVVSGGG